MDGAMLSSGWLLAAMGIYTLVLFVSLLGKSWENKTAAGAAFWLLAAGGVFNAVMLGTMWTGMGRPPFKTLYETLLLAPLCIAAVGVVMARLHKLPLLTALAAAGALICMFCAYQNPDWEVVLMPPALQSAWFVPHVVTYFISYGALFISAVLAGLAIFKAAREKTLNPSGAGAGDVLRYESAANNAAIFGFVTLTFGLAMGAAWGKNAWGDYWQWDVKENWAFITWLAYLAYHHTRLLGAWRKQRAMWLNLACFGAVLFTYLGMNLLPAAKASMHVYQ